MRVLALLATIVVVSLSFAAVALGFRGATTYERVVIIKAVRASKLTSAVPDADFTVKHIRIATVRSGYAGGQLVGIGPHRSSVQDAYVLLHRVSRKWQVIEIGGVLSCIKPGRDVLRDLNIPCA